MAGILDLFGGDINDPRVQGLLAAFAAMGEASGPSKLPVTVASVLGKASMAGLGGYQSAQKQKMLEEQFKLEQQMKQIQLQAMQDKMKQEAIFREAGRSAYQTPLGEANSSVINKTGNLSPTLGNAEIQAEAMKSATGGINPDRFLSAALPLGANPLEAFKAAAELRKTVTPPIHLKEGETLFHPTTYAPLATNAKPIDMNKLIITGPDGKPMLNQALFDAQKALRAAGKTDVNLKVDAFEPASSKVQGASMEQMVKNYDTLSSAPAVLENINQAKKLVSKAGGFVGQFADVKLSAVKALNNNLGTNINPNEVANAEELRSRMFLQILENLKKLDAQPSAQQQRIMQEALGSIGTDPKAIPKVLDAFADTIRNKVKIHNKKVSEAEGNAIRFPYSLKVDLPSLGESDNAPQENPVNALRKKYGLEPLP